MKDKIIGISCKWQCPKCGNLITIRRPLSWPYEFPQPSKCGCGRDKRFKLLDFKLINFIVEEVTE